MQTKTFEIGEQRTVTIQEVLRNGLGQVAAVLCVDDQNEGWVLIGTTHQIDPEQHIKQRVVMQFFSGGPMNGYWTIMRVAEPVTAQATEPVEYDE